VGKLIAVAGKGGVGKTTVAALLVRHLIETKRTPILVVDADPNYTLGDALGIPIEQTIGTMREKFFGDRLEVPAGMSREAVLERNMHAALHEKRDLDLLVMGRQEGPGCYCYLNNILRKFLDTLSDDYPYTVVDNEAGMEHLSRRTTRKVDLMLVVADHTVKGARAAGRIVGLVDELELDVRRKALILNRVPGEIAAGVRAESERSGLELLVGLPDDGLVAEIDAKGGSLMDLPPESPALVALNQALSGLSLERV
jgi:CO dehydrogenase maturation factor